MGILQSQIKMVSEIICFTQGDTVCSLIRTGKEQKAYACSVMKPPLTFTGGFAVMQTSLGCVREGIVCWVTDSLVASTVCITLPVGCAVFSMRILLSNAVLVPFIFRTLKIAACWKNMHILYRETQVLSTLIKCLPVSGPSLGFQKGGFHSQSLLLRYVCKKSAF